MSVDVKTDDILWYLLWIGVAANIAPFITICVVFATSNACKVYNLAPPNLGPLSVCTDENLGNLPPQWFIFIACLTTAFINIIYYCFLYFRYVRTFTALHSMFYPLQRTAMTSYLLFVTMALKAGVGDWLDLLLAGIFCFLGYECIAVVDYFKHSYVCSALKNYLLRHKTSKDNDYLIVKQRVFLGYSKTENELKTKLKKIGDIYQVNKSFISITDKNYKPALFFIRDTDKEAVGADKLLPDEYNVVKTSPNQKDKIIPFFTSKDQGNIQTIVADLNTKVVEITLLTKKLLDYHQKAKEKVNNVIARQEITPRIDEWSLKSSFENVGLYIIGLFLIFFPFSYFIVGVYAGSHVAVIATTYIYISFELLWLTIGVYFTGLQRGMEKLLLITQVLGYFVIGIVLITDVNCGGCT